MAGDFPIFPPDAGEGDLDLLLETDDQFAVGGDQRRPLQPIMTRRVHSLIHILISALRAACVCCRFLADPRCRQGRK